MLFNFSAKLLIIFHISKQSADFFIYTELSIYLIIDDEPADWIVVEDPFADGSDDSNASILKAYTDYASFADGIAQ